MRVSAIVILAAGKSKRMKTTRSKLLHELLGKPMIFYPLTLAQKLKPKKIILVVSPANEELKSVLNSQKVEFALQREPRGTADAVKASLPNLKSLKGSVLILYGDDPLLTLKTLRNLIQIHFRTKAALSLLTAEYPEPSQYGRIIRDDDGRIVCIVESADATPEQKRIKEVNAGVYCVQLEFLKQALQQIKAENRQKEFYLTDLVQLAVSQRLKVETYTTPDYTETLGVNTREELAQACAVLQKRINREWMAKGVTIESPANVWIGPDVKIGPDTVIESGARILGRTKIGKNCGIQANARIIDAIIEDNVEIRQGSVIEGSRILESAIIGPYARIRPGSFIGKKAKIGNFVELKKTVIGEKSSASHLTYLGDAIIGKKVNIGAGTITCNYDGERKYQTIIEDEAFIGSDSQFVAPVKVGKRAYIASGSTITDDVPKESLVIARSRQVVKPGWVKKRKQKKEK